MHRCDDLKFKVDHEMYSCQISCRWEQLSLGYTESTGLPALREEISFTYTSIPAKNIVVLAPAEGIYLTLKALLQPGDHVVVTYPGYQTLHEVARSIGCKLSFWQPELNQQRSWEFNVQQLEALIQSDTKVNNLSLHVAKVCITCKPAHGISSCRKSSD